jgi:RNA polymerase sigma factor (TIGR02999 family)
MSLLPFSGKPGHTERIQMDRIQTHGNELAKERLFAGLYDELHRLAQRALRRDGRLLPISATTLLHESYLSVAKADFTDSQRFLAYAARTMRGLIIDETRRRRALKYGGAFVITSLDEDAESDQEDGAAYDHELLRINDALDELEAKDPALAELVQLRYFCGLSLAQIGVLRGVTQRTVQRQWDKARLLLFDMLQQR